MVEHFSPVLTPLQLQPILSLYTVAWPMFRLNWSGSVSAGLSSHLYSKQSLTAISGSKLWYLPANQHFCSWQDNSQKLHAQFFNNRKSGGGRRRKKKLTSKKMQTSIFFVNIRFKKWCWHGKKIMWIRTTVASVTMVSTYNHKFIKREQCPFCINL